ncbi:MAG: hypothetical protein AAF356_03775 [Planctomycetota bacterium]
MIRCKRARVAVAAIAGGIAAAALPGCLITVREASMQPRAMVDQQRGTPARPGETSASVPGERRGASQGPVPWPARWGDGLTGRKGVIREVEGPVRRIRGVRLGEFHFLRAAEEEYADAAFLARAIDAARTPGADPTGFRFRPEGPGSFVFLPDPAFEGPDAKPVPRRADDPAELFKFISGRVLTSWRNTPGVEIQRTWVALADPIGRDEPIGTIVLLPGLFGTPEPMIDRFERSLRRRGWAVVRLLAPPSRFTQRLRVEVDPSDGFGAEGQMIADELTGRAAEVAYAADAALAHAKTLRPALADRPVVLLGMSGGAIASPTAFAWAKGNYDAVVLIAGGTDFLRINAESNYAPWVEAIELVPPGAADDPLGDDKREQSARADRSLWSPGLGDAYLERAHLDGHHLAPRLAGVPTLLIHATADRAVPAPRGDDLWRRAGEPERWEVPVGHEVLFLMLPGMADRVHKWLDANVIDPGVPEPGE